MLPNPKLHSLASASALRSEWRASGKRVVLTNGVFDLLHTGHLYYLQQARALGDILVVALNGDQSVRALKGPTRPILDEQSRAYALAATWFVDAIVLFQAKRLTAEIEALRPDAYAKAGDYSLDKLDPGERSALEACGASIHFLPFLPGFSTTELIRRITAAGDL
ncbi:adenylyltransferase/cytidyltransferase family protein [Nibricoccus sp. IMCC34717]|uniref:adenylyltransferase/cytidyltransferase family protein n=1 Tax=Nibricoccus sp. IMCC34717 TaxID=3034021 RepID=UPI00384D090E